MTTLRPTKRLPLFIPHRDYPRPSAKSWLERASKLFSLENPFNGGNPWLPLTSIEGFLVVGHSKPDAPLCEIPPELTIRVRMRPQDYELLKERCIEQLASFQNNNPTFLSKWNEFADKADSRGVKLKNFGLQFSLDTGLNPRAAANITAEKYIQENSGSAWLYRAISLDLPVLPTEDLKANELPSARLPEDTVAKFKAVCYAVDPEAIHILLPSNTNATEFKTELIAEGQLAGEINLSYGDPEALTRFVDNKVLQVVQASEEIRLAPSDNHILVCDQGSLTSPVAKMGTALEILAWSLGQALTVGATDIHIDAQDTKQASIRLRINGVLKVMGYITVEQLKPVVSVAKIRCHIDPVATNIPRDGKFKVRCGDRVADIRLSTLPVEKGISTEGMALRVLGLVRIPSMDALGMTPRQMTEMRWVNERDNGLFLVTGPTGSGKTTTLNCVLREVAGPEINTLTVEDPVELPLPWVKQSQVNTHEEIEYTFTKAVKTFMRQDPDVIMIGEVRDTETAKITMQAALTGHLVFATLHTNNALMALSRLKDLGVEQALIADTLQGVQAQRLIRTLCTCREEVKPSPECKAYVKRYRQRIEKQLSPDPKVPDAAELIDVLKEWEEKDITYRHSGCNSCNNTGYNKSRAVMEIYLTQGEPEIIDMIIEGAPISRIQRHYDSNGYLNLASQMMRVFARHETSFKEIQRYLPLI